jgi:hypothetical protein
MVRPAARAPRRRGGQRDVTERQAQDSLPVQVRSGETPGSPVVKPPCVVERPGAKRGGIDWPVRSVSEAREASSFPRRWRIKRVPSRSCGGEGHGRRLGSRSGRRGTLRRSGRGTVRRLSWELGRPSSAPPLRVAGSSPVYNRRREVAGGREGVGGGSSTGDGQDSTTCPEGRAPASSMHDKERRNPGECRAIG